MMSRLRQRRRNPSFSWMLEIDAQAKTEAIRRANGIMEHVITRGGDGRNAFDCTGWREQAVHAQYPKPWFVVAAKHQRLAAGRRLCDRRRREEGRTLPPHATQHADVLLKESVRRAEKQRNIDKPPTPDARVPQ